ncbi:MAG TPA: alanine--tRNA ligase-related protein, partial [Terrimicrobiaceae bacterium]
TSIIQGTKNFTDFAAAKISNYETDIFRPIFDELEKLSGQKYCSTLPTPAQLSSLDAQQATDMAFRVIGDHLRTLSFAIADGIEPGNTERHYVLRRILRRAVRYGRTLGFREPFFHKLVGILCRTMGSAFPELREKQQLVEEVLRREEETFNKTLDGGIEVFEKVFLRLTELECVSAFAVEVLKPVSSMSEEELPVVSRGISHLEAFRSQLEELGRRTAVLAHIDYGRFFGREPGTFAHRCKLLLRADAVTRFGDIWGGNVSASAAFRKSIEDLIVRARSFQGAQRIFPGRAAFVLYDTYGFPLDLTELMARERGLTVDVAGFERLMEEQRTRARKAQKKEIITVSEENLQVEPTQFLGYDFLETEAVVESVARARASDEYDLIVDRTACYGEMGGQVGDTGFIHVPGPDWSEVGRLQIRNTQRKGGVFIHRGVLAAGRAPEVGEAVRVAVDASRRGAIQRHHTVTHLLHWALHEVVSKHAIQKGSYVGPDKLTFDFNHQPLTAEQARDVEKLVNERIIENAAVSFMEVPYQAIRGRDDIMQFFGDKYGEMVRVVQIGGQAGELNGYSMELCAGTHTRATGEIGLFRILSEAAIAAGVRRIEAISGLPSFEAAVKETERLKALATKLNSPVAEIEKKLDALLAQQKELEKALNSARQREAVDRAKQLAGSAEIVNGIPAILANLGKADGDTLQSVADVLKGSFQGLIVLAGTSETNSVALVAAVSPEFTRRIQAGKLVQQIAPLVGGKGGGREENARGGGKDPSKIEEALGRAKTLLLESS